MPITVGIKTLIVNRIPLDATDYYSYNNPMNKLDTVARAQILTSLVEGNSIAGTCRMFGVNKVTVLRLLADAGTLAAQYHDLTVRDLATKRVQVDEIWAFCHSKENNVRPQNWGRGHGDNWTWVSMDADSKLVINWLVGGRDSAYATDFVMDLADRLTDRIQLTSDGWQPYREAVTRAFGTDIDYAMLIKEYAKERQGFARYSPPICISARPSVQTGNPTPEHINTSFVERQNLTMRMQMRRFTRLTNGFSKRLENHKYAIALHYFYYNFIRKHQTIKTTPAVMAGVADKVWTMLDFVKLLEREETLLGGRLTDYKSAKKRAG
jgi:IS1 family transposase